MGMEERGLPKQSPLLKQIQRLILTICMVDMGLDIMDMVVMPGMDTLGMDIMDIMEGRGGLLKQSLLLKQIQRQKLILTISMADMGLDIMDMVDMPDMDTLGMDIMGMENKPVQQLNIKIVTFQITCI